MKQEVKIGQTDYTVLILIRDTAGAPKTGLTNASAGIDVCYTRVETDNDVVVTAGAPVALATPALTDPHLDWGFLEVDATNAPGLYRLDIADGVFASGAWSAVVSMIATGIDPVHIEFVLIAFDPRDSVRMGLTALPNAAADGVGGLPISDAGGLDLDTKLANTNEITAARMGALTDWIDGGRLDLLLDDAPTTAEFNARTLPSADYVVTTDTIAGVTLCGTCTTNTDMRGTNSAALASVCTEARLSELDAGTGGKMANQMDIVQTDTTTDIPATLAAQGLSLAAIAADAAAILTDTGTTLDAYIKQLLTGLIYKKVITEATGALEQFDVSNVSLGTIAAWLSSDGDFTTQKKTVI